MPVESNFPAAHSLENVEELGNAAIIRSDLLITDH
jgi:hypothetical protein